MSAQLRTLNVGIQEKRTTISRRTRFIEQEAFLKSDLARAQSESAYLDAILPSPDGLIDFPRDLSVWASQRHLDVGFSFVSEAESIGDAPGHTVFVLTATGSLSDIIAFLQTIEHSRYSVKFNQYDLVAEEGKYTAFINGHIFSR